MLAPMAAAQQPSTNLLVIDQDAHLVSPVNAGAVFNVTLGAGTTAFPGVEASAQAGAPLQLINSVAVSPVDGRAYMADLGADDTPPINPIPRILALDGVTGAIEVIWQGSPLVQPFGIAFAPDGRLFIADPEADPAFLGASVGCGAYGAIFIINTATCAAAPCAPTLLSAGTAHGFPPPLPSAFGEPLGIAYDPAADRIYVADACASELGYSGSVFQVDPLTGFVQLVSSTPDFLGLISLDVRTDGTPLVVDQGVVGDSIVWALDTGNPDPENNATQFTGGTQYSQIQDVSVDATGRVHVVDWGDYDVGTGTFLVPPAIFSVDDTDTNPGTNGRLVNESVVFVTPVGGAVVPLPIATSVSPPTILGPTNVVIQGSGLFPGLTLDLGPGAAISAVDYAPGYPKGQAIQALVTPTGTQVVPLGCAGFVDVRLTHPFGGTAVYAGLVAIQGNTGGITPRPPLSRRGDANGDGIVDGLDLALLGLHFGAEYCDGPTFYNDADFTDNDIIDGADLAILAAYFGTRP